VHNILEVKDSSIVIVLTGEDNVVQIGGMDIGDSVLMRIPSAKAHIQASHEGDSAIHQAEFLMVGPVEDHIIIHAIQTLERIAGHLCKRNRVQGQVLERGTNRGCQFLTIGKMIGVAEHCDIGMEVFESVLGV
jgi:hypothetical protein